MRHVLVYTDGSCLGNPGPGGWGTILQLANTSHRKELCGGYRLTTNNRMEIMAALEGLRALTQPCEVELFSDSQYLCNSIKKGWIFAWRRKGWRRTNGTTVPNTDLWEGLLPLLQCHSVNFHWLRGHAGHPENERCDQIARSVAARENLTMDKGYEHLYHNKPSEGQKKIGK